MTNRLNHFRVGDPRREWAPQAYGQGPAAVLAEPATAECGCRASWQLGEFLSGTFTATLAGAATRVEFGWWPTVSHRQSCKKTEV